MKNKKKTIIISSVSVALCAAVAVTSVFLVKRKNEKLEVEGDPPQTIEQSDTTPEEAAEPTASENKTEESKAPDTTAPAPTTEKQTEKKTETTTKKPPEKTTAKPKATTTKPAPQTSTPKGPYYLNEIQTIPGGRSASEAEKLLFDLLNDEREANGVPRLKWDNNLHTLAMIRCKEQLQTFGHTRPDGRSWDSVFSDNNARYHYAAENVGCSYGGDFDYNKFVPVFANDFMESPGHRKNVLNPKSEYAAVAIIEPGDGTVYIAHLFYK